MLEKSQYIQAGIVAKPHGISGETAVRLSPEIDLKETQPTFIFIEIDNGLVPFRVSGLRYKSDDVILVKLPLLASEEKIRKVMDFRVYLDPQDVASPGADFSNLNSFNEFEVIDATAGSIGHISGIQDISANPLFIIEGPQGEVLIPVAEDFIVNIDDDNQIIEMNIPEGLLGLNSPD
ncbi:ribosome maturation factor RimM [Marinilabilia rubra]|uniref:Ribosome maturation factor RimM n=1 Tax=Marinilabilia rubra TaxID=2162893 RepID=A0A2U2BDA4_9BACT|nr:16S rRNA processing protein RimM [Marinilabilia rubra]PWE01041.1 16S rRNA processing protein RimM [Marinilabilia rubra]